MGLGGRFSDRRMDWLLGLRTSLGSITWSWGSENPGGQGGDGYPPLEGFWFFQVG